MENYYHILGILQTATAEQVRYAYERRLAEWKKNGANDMQQYLLIEEAYENLGNDLRKGWYDERLARYHAGLDDEEEYNVAATADSASHAQRPAVHFRSKHSKGSNASYVAGGVSLAAIAGILLKIVLHLVISTANTTPSYDYVKAIHIDTSHGFTDSLIKTLTKDTIGHSLQQ